jgi:hypothetical protein
MSVVSKVSSSMDEVVAEVGRVSGILVRHDLGDAVTVSFIYDGNLDRPRTCQWRLAADTSEATRAALSRLLSALDRCGVTYETPRVVGTLCHFEDHGPWPDRA